MSDTFFLHPLMILVFWCSFFHLRSVLPFLQQEYGQELDYLWELDTKSRKLLAVTGLFFLVFLLVPSSFFFVFPDVANSFIRPPQGLWSLFPCLVVLCYFDTVSKYLPDEVQWMAGLASLAQVLLLSGGGERWLDMILNFGFLSMIFLLTFLYAKVRNQDGLGLGDLKLLLWMGMWLSWKSLFSVFVVACIAALLIRASQGLEDWIAERNRKMRLRSHELSSNNVKETTVADPSDSEFAFGPWILVAFVWVSVFG